MTITLSAEEAERRAVMREAVKSMQDGIKASLSDPKALARAIDGGWTRRRDAIQMLGFLGRDVDVVRVALDERDAQAVIDHAMKFVPVPVDVVVHGLTMKRGDAATGMRHWIPAGNFLYAEEEIVRIVAKSPGRLAATVLDAFGTAGFASTATILRKHAKLAAMRTYADAIAAGRAQDKPELSSTSIPRDRMWDGPTERAFAAVVALRRLGADVDVAAVAAWRDAVDKVMPAAGSSVPDRVKGRLGWVLFDAGAEREFDAWLALDPLHDDTLYDMAATLIRRGDDARLERLVPKLARYPTGASARFCHWPVADWCHARGLVPAPADSFAEIYCLSRDADIAPPAWWRWRTAWTRGFHSDRLRGLL